MTRIKICGLTRTEDIPHVAQANVHAVGFVFAVSKRQVTVEQARALIRLLPPLIQTVGVFMDQPIREVLEIAATSGLDRIQLHGAESPEECGAFPGKVLKRIDIAVGERAESLQAKCEAYPHCDLLLDPGAGDGQPFDFSLARTIKRPFVLAGGLTPANVSAAIHAARPAGVDVSSGVEATHGCKSESDVRQFVAAVRESDVQLHA